MAAPVSKPVPAPEQPVIEEEDEEEEYESDEYDVEDDEADADYQRDDAGDEDEEDDDDEGDEEVGEGKQSLTALLVADPKTIAQVEEDDAGYAPPGETDPAEDPIDGNARVPGADHNSVSEKVSNSTAANLAVPAVGLKRKTSGDEEDVDDVDEEDEESDAKKLKA